MNRAIISLCAALALAACSDGNPLTDVDGDVTPDPTPPTEDPDTSTSGIPDVLAANLQSVDFDPGADTLVVTYNSLDTGIETAAYTRTPALDVPGYRAFSVQEDPLDRLVIVMTQQSADGAVQAGSAADGGQFNRFFGGGYYRQIGTYNPPSPEDVAQVSYAGKYAGMTNIDSPTPSALLPVPGGADPAIAPRESARISGDIFLNANFTDALVNGGIYNRIFMDDPTVPLEDIALIPATIESDGTFFGDVEVAGLVGEKKGDWGGTFGGDGATSVAGVLYMEEWDPVLENEAEYGVFVLDKCGSGGPSPICDNVNP